MRMHDEQGGHDHHDPDIRHDGLRRAELAQFLRDGNLNQQATAPSHAGERK